MPLDSPKNRAAHGRAQRKHCARGDLADWKPSLRKRGWLTILREHERLCVPELLEIKRERMAVSAFAFFRGAAPLMAYDLSLTPNTSIQTQICGDAHIQNLGAYAGDDGRLVFDVNDFDETAQAPFEYDLKRMAVSVQLAGRQAKLAGAQTHAAVGAFLHAYIRLMRDFTTMSVLDVARYRVRGRNQSAAVAAILKRAQRATPEDLVARLTQRKGNGFVFRNARPLLWRVTGEERSRVLESLALYRETLAPERRHLLDQLDPVDVAFKVVGTGSVGLRDYCVLCMGNDERDAVFLQIKQELRSAWQPYVHAALHQQTDAFTNQGERVVRGQRAMQFESDPLLGWTRVAGGDFIVRQLSDHKATLDATELRGTTLASYAVVCGLTLAHGHARAGDAHMISGYIGKGSAFPAAIAAFADSYAKQTIQDWRSFAKHLDARKR